MNKTAKLYEGKAKILWETGDPGLLVQEFKDDATAFDGTKHEVISGKGRLNNAISSRLFAHLAERHVRTHFVRKLSEREMLVLRLAMLPIEVVVRNAAAGSLVRRYGIPEGTAFDPPIVEFYLKNDARHDPMLTEEHIRAMTLATPDRVGEMRRTAIIVNGILTDFLRKRSVALADFKLEFGTSGDELVLGDEISPDTCRLRDARTGEILDKDRFRRDLGGFIEAYSEVLARVSS